MGFVFSSLSCFEFALLFVGIKHPCFRRQVFFSYTYLMGETVTHHVQTWKLHWCWSSSGTSRVPGDGPRCSLTQAFAAVYFGQLEFDCDSFGIESVKFNFEIVSRITWEE